MLDSSYCRVVSSSECVRILCFVARYSNYYTLYSARSYHLVTYAMLVTVTAPSSDLVTSNEMAQFIEVGNCRGHAFVVCTLD